MVKEVGTGVLAAAGVGGTGYGIYYVMQPHTLEDLIINDVISKTEENERKFGYPLTRVSSEWWNKAFHRYIYESDGESDTKKKLTALSGNSDKEKLDDFKRQCIDLLKSPIGDADKDTENKEKANKWCVTYETVEDKLTNKKLAEVTSKKSEWKGKYESSTTSGKTYKSKIEAIYTSLSSSTDDDDTKKAKAIRQWCEHAFHLSASKKDDVNGTSGNCVFETT